MVTPRYFTDETLDPAQYHEALCLDRGFKASYMKDLAFGGIKIHIPHLFPFFKAE